MLRLVTTLIILALVSTLGRSKMLKLTLSSPVGGDRRVNPSDKVILRQNIVYFKTDASRTDHRVQVQCSLPDWYNTTSHPVIYTWSLLNESLKDATKPESRQDGQLSILSSSSNAFYKCVVKDAAHQRPLDDWSETILKFYKDHKKGPQDEVRVEPPSAALNYTSEKSTPNDLAMSFKCVCSSCDVNERFSWFLDGKNITSDHAKDVSFNESFMNIAKPSPQDTGVYMCVANSDPKKLAFLNITGSPVYQQKGDRRLSENKLEGESAFVHPELYGNPINNVRWKFRKQEELDEGNKEEQIKEKEEYINIFDAQKTPDNDFSIKHPGLAKRLRFNPTLDSPVGELEIINLEKEDRAVYIAEAQGSDIDLKKDTSRSETLVRVKGKLDALWPFLGIVVEVIILVAIIFIYEKRRSKQETETEETPDQKKPLTSTNNDDLRQRNKAKA